MGIVSELIQKIQNSKQGLNELPKKGFKTLTVKKEYLEPLKLVYQKMLLEKKTKKQLKSILAILPDIEKNV